eukprot:CAMPEP_0116895814 /NCGR_PEP_ID=MMETSP0467-20121206/5229_1 /TAXON_ID=283647 /ORGANISM="Mesodinium pulex, Strain SPMC105" /LENGTH=87 /DNA_ID=CAMNT_0004566703 /DNA_START=1660 /DNA_END=1923 /DNA_ORIENTATION=-
MFGQEQTTQTSKNDEFGLIINCLQYFLSLSHMEISISVMELYNNKLYLKNLSKNSSDSTATSADAVEIDEKHIKFTKVTKYNLHELI